jgi:hypothetical protein
MHPTEDLIAAASAFSAAGFLLCAAEGWGPAKMLDGRAGAPGPKMAGAAEAASSPTARHPTSITQFIEA